MIGTSNIATTFKLAKRFFPFEANMDRIAIESSRVCKALNKLKILYFLSWFCILLSSHFPICASEKGKISIIVTLLITL